jgi:hypothetical protein
MESSVVGALLCVLVLAVWVGCRVEDTRARRAACTHRWGDAVYFAGYGTRHCKLCGAQEPWTPPRDDDDDG